MNKHVILDHGSGGVAGRDLIERIFLPRLDNPVLAQFEDSAVLSVGPGRIALTTDSYVVDPIFSPGGDIGNLAVHGTINDLAMQGAVPVALSLSLILEEGFAIADLERLADSIAEASKKSHVPVVTGDTKVVPKGKADKVFINTSGIGTVADNLFLGSNLARPGDQVILSGYMGDHGLTIMAARAGLYMSSSIISDTAPLHTLVSTMLQAAPDAIRCMRDPTRGGVATVLSELAVSSKVRIEIDEDTLPIRPGVDRACELLGLDPLYLANEGKCIAVVDRRSADSVISAMRKTAEGRDARIIGTITENISQKNPARDIMKTKIGGSRIVGPLCGEPLPRIC